MPYSEAHANHAINFIEQLKLTKGRWAGQPFKGRIYNVIFNYCRIHCECLKFDFFGKTSIAFAQKQVRGFVFMLHAVLCGQNMH